MGFVLPTVGPPLQLRYSTCYFPLQLSCTSVTAPSQLPLELRCSFRCSSCTASVTVLLQLRYSSDAPPLQLRYSPLAPPLQLLSSFRYSSVAAPLHLRYSSITASVTAPLQIHYSSVAPPFQLRYRFRYSCRYSSVTALHYSSVAPPLQLRYSFLYSSVVQLRYRSATGPLSSCCFCYGSVTASVTASLQPAALRCSLPIRLRYSSATNPLQLRSFPLLFLLQAPLPASISVIVEACK